MQKKHAVITGIFILVAIAILVVTIFTLGSQRNTFVAKVPVKAVFEDINGLKEGNNVWFSGVKTGTVKTIKLKGNSVVEVTLSMDHDAMAYIHKDSKIKISTDGFIGNKILVIYGGSSSAPLLEKNDYLAVEKMPGTDEMMATLQENNKNLLQITDNFKKISQNIADGSGTIGALINDKSLFQSLQATVAELHSAINNLDTTSVKTRQFMANLAAFGANLNNPGTSIHKLVTDTAMFTSINNSIAKFNEAASAARDFADSLKKAGGKLTQDNNVIGVLLNDTTTANHVRGIFSNLETSSHKLDEDLEAVQHNFLLRGFFKKKEKAEADSARRR